jgi:glyoxylase-like metal-dependent hydrolase (beta-lactamase superfamily II)
VEVIDHETELLSGIRTRHMPGHTPGHQIVEVDTSGGVVLVAGDAAMDLEVNVRKQIPPGFLDTMADTMDGLRELARADANGSHVLLTHDAELFSRYPDGVGAHH